MVQKKTLTKKFQCSICEIWYREQKYAHACEEWCRTHNSCNLDIIKHRVN